MKSRLLAHSRLARRIYAAWGTLRGHSVIANCSFSGDGLHLLDTGPRIVIDNNIALGSN